MERMASFTPRALYPQEKNTWYPVDRRLGGLQSRSGRGGEEKNSHPLSGLEPPIIQPAALCYITELEMEKKELRSLDSVHQVPTPGGRSIYVGGGTK
jgi:hypothetical protein